MSSKINDLTALEESDAEQACGISILKLGVKDVPKLGLLGALAWVLHRRDEPNLTYSAFMNRSKASDIYAFLFGDDEDEAAEEDAEALPEDPFPGGDEGGAPGGVADAEGPVLSGDRGPAE